MTAAEIVILLDIGRITPGSVLVAEDANIRFVVLGPGYVRVEYGEGAEEWIKVSKAEEEVVEHA